MTSRFDPQRMCLHLRCKQMFYEHIDVENPREPPGPASDTTVYWCECTQTGRGPDEQVVNIASCASRSRRCFEGFASLA